MYFFFSVIEYTSCSQRKINPQNTLERWQGPPHINKVKLYEIVLPFVKLKSVYLVCLDIKSNQ